MTDPKQNSSRKPKNRQGGNQGGNQGGGKASQQKAAGKKRSRGRSRSRSKKVDPLKYWGDVALLPEPDAHVISTPDPSVVVNSLGRPPIPGHENASKHYFSLVYERAAMLAGALAAAGGLGEDYGSFEDEPDEDENDDEDTEPDE